MKKFKLFLLLLFVNLGFSIVCKAQQFNVTCGTIVPTVCDLNACGGILVPLTASGVFISPGFTGFSLELDYDGDVLSFCTIANCNANLLPLTGIARCQSHIFGGPANMRKLRIAWSNGTNTTLTSPPNPTLFLILSFRYYGGSTDIRFNNSVYLGQACEVSNGDGYAIDDTGLEPPYYTDGGVYCILLSPINTVNPYPCDGSAATFMVTGSTNNGPITYSWTAPSPDWIGTSTSNSITYTNVGAASGNITVRATNNCNGCASSQSFYVDVSMNSNNGTIIPDPESVPWRKNY